MSLLHLSLNFKSFFAFNLLFNLEHNLEQWGLDEDGNSVLHLACDLWKEKEIIFDLVQEGHPKKEFINTKDKKGRTCFHNLCYRGPHSLVKKLIQLAPEIEIDLPCNEGNTPFIMSINSRDLRKAKLLKKHGANINYQNSKGNSALHYACMRNYVDCAKQLIDWGAKINVKNRYRLTPLNFTIKNENWDIFCLLLKHNAEVNYVDVSGLTPLHHSLKCNIGYVEKLLQSGAKPSKTGKNKQAVLQRACFQNQKEHVKILLKFTTLSETFAALNYTKSLQNREEIVDTIQDHIKFSRIKYNKASRLAYEQDYPQFHVE